MNEDKHKSATKKFGTTVVIGLILFYLLIGFAFNMQGEYSLAKKYGMPQNSVLQNPWSYVRSIIFSPFWPLFVSANIYHDQKPFGGPISPISQ